MALMAIWTVFMMIMMTIVMIVMTRIAASKIRIVIRILGMDMAQMRMAACRRGNMSGISIGLRA